MEEINLSEKNPNYIYDPSRDIYVSRQVLMKNRRTMRVVGIFRRSNDPVLKGFAKEVSILKKPAVIDFTSIKSLEAFFKNLGSPYPGYRPRIITKEELERYYEWARRNDHFMYEEMLEMFGGEIVYDTKKRKYLLAKVFGDKDNPIDYLENIEEIIGEISTIGVYSKAREVLERKH